MKPNFTRLGSLATLITISFGSQAVAQSTFIGGTSAPTGTQWGTAANWSPSVPNASNAVANLNGNRVTGITVATNGGGTGYTSAPTVGLSGGGGTGAVANKANIGYTVAVSDTGTAGTYPYTLGTLATSIDGGAMVIGDTGVTTDILNFQATGTPVIDIPNINASIFYYANILGNQGLKKTGAGRFTLRFNTTPQTYTGNVLIEGGTFGIQNNYSLGDDANDIVITPSLTADSTLFAEPGNNTDAVTLPATRTITLNDPLNSDLFDARLSSTDLRVVFTIDGDITEVAASACFLDKVGAGYVVLNGTNSWTGGTIVSEGILVATKPAALPSYASATPFTAVKGSSALAVRYGDGSPSWTSGEINTLLTAGGLSFDATARFGIDTTGNALPATLADDIPASNFSKIGAGDLTLSSTQSTVAGIFLYGGKLTLGGTGLTATGGTFRNLLSGTVLDLATTSASFAALDEVSGGTTTITNGSLTYTGPTLTLSGNNGTTTDLSGLSSFTYSTSGTELKIENANNVNGSLNTVLFSAGTNTITAVAVSPATGRVAVGGGASANGGALLVTARLGTTNTIITDNLTLGGFNAAGLMNFQSSLVNPSLKLRGNGHTEEIPVPIPLLKIGETSSGSRTGAGTLNLTNGSGDILATSIVIGRHIAGSSNGDTSTLTIPAGTVTAPTLVMAEKTSNGAPAVTAIFNQQGNTSVAIDSIVMGQTGPGPAPNNTPASTVQNLFPSYNLEGGTLTTAEIKAGTLSTALGLTAQVETATAAGTITLAGDVSVTVTGDSIGAAIPILVTVLNADTAATWAGKVRTALGLNATITGLYTVGGTGTAIVLTRITPGVNDGNLNIALANGTTTGVTAAPTSANTNGNVVSNINRTLKLQGGTLINKVGANLAISGPTPPLATGNNPTTILVPGNTTAIVDSTLGQTVNFTDVAFSTRINSATPSAGTLQVDGDVVLTTSTLTVFDDAPVDAVAVAPGTKLVLIDYQDGSLTGTFTGIADGATVNVTKGLVTNAFVLDYNDPAYGGKAVTLTIPGAANNYASWATDNGISGQPFDEDFDNDGMDNGVEYALGKNPTVSDTPAGVVSNGGLTTTFTKGSDAKTNGDVTWQIETSTDLGIADDWTVNVPLVTDTANDISITFTPSTPAKNFARLKVVKVP